MEQTGTQLGAYRLYEKVGGGGFATVYVARDTRTNEMVAIKILHAHLAQDAQFIARFRREAEALQKIPPHPNIVRLREWGRQGDTYYLVMDFLEGKDLSQILAERKRLSVNEALSIAMQIAQALDAAHRHGLVHRDIKPGNIKVTPQGLVKVMDFGIARAAEGTKLTQTGTFMGTPDYIAPEVWEGKPADIRSDLYALGAILYEMLAGISPFHADTPATTMRRHLTEQLPPLQTVRADVPPNVEQWLAKLLAKQPEARYQTPGELLAALYAGQASALVEQARQDAPTMIARPIPQKKNAWLIPAGSAIAGGFILLIVFIFALALREPMVALTPTTTATLSIQVAIPRPTDVLLASRPMQESTQTPMAVVVTATPIPSPTQTETPRYVSAPYSGEERVIGGAPMVFVPAGEFTVMSTHSALLGGIRDYDCVYDERPRQIYISSFWIDKFEVTNSQYKKCLDAGKCRSRPKSLELNQNDDLPVYSITGYDAEAFCAFVGKRLPTNEEWAKAADGSQGGIYSEKGTGSPVKVGASNSRSRYGAMDMLGNVWEIVVTREGWRVRGGAANTNSIDARVTSLCRFLDIPRFQYIGFRCAQ